MTNAELTSAILLVVEVVLPDQGVASFLEASLAPVLFPPDQFRIGLDCLAACLVDLVKAFPAGGCQGGGHQAKSVGRCIFGGAFQPQAETAEASASALGLVFEPVHRRPPACVVIILIDYLQAEREGKPGAFLLPFEILLQRVDVGIAVVKGRSDSVVKKTFHNRTAARSATGVQQHPVNPLRSNHCRRPIITSALFHIPKTKVSHLRDPSF